MKYAGAALYLGLAACGNGQTGGATLANEAAEGACIDLDDQSEITLQGKLTTQLFAGPPNYESIAAGDAEERAFILELPHRICIEDSEGFADPNVRFDRVHVTGDSEEDTAILRSAVGRNVAVTGEGMGAHTGHHRAPLVIFVREISIRANQQTGEAGNNEQPNERANPDDLSAIAGATRGDSVSGGSRQITAQMLVGAWAPEGACASDGGIRYRSDGTFSHYEGTGRWEILGNTLVETDLVLFPNGDEAMAECVANPVADRSEILSIDRRGYRIRWPDGSIHDMDACPGASRYSPAPPPCS